MTEPDRILAKPVRISASMRTARHLVGFPAALARLAGVAPGSLRSRAAIDAACAAVAEHDPAAGPVRVVAVRTGRRTFGHALAGDADVRLLAAAMLHRRTLLGVLDGALVPKLARKAGIRSATPRRWASDPELDARARAAVNAVHRWFGVRFLAAVPGEAWSSALVVPRPLRTAQPDPEPHLDWDDAFGGALFAPAEDPWEPLPPGADLPVARQRPAPAPEAGPLAFEETLGLPEPGPAMPQAPRAELGPLPRPDAHEAAQAVVARPYPRPELIGRYRRRVDVIVVLAAATTRSLLVSDLPGCETAAASEDAEEAALRARISAAVAAAATQPAPEKPSDPPQVETGFGESELGPAMFAVAGHAGLPRELGARLVAATPHQLARRARSAAALLRRSLPSDLHDVAGMLGDCFEGSSGACKFLRLHEGFTPEDNRRVAETLRLMPCLRPFHENRGVLDAIRSGARLDAVLRAALGRPVRPKTLRALRTGRFDPRPRARDATRRDLGLLVPGLDAYHAADPHLPALDPPQLAAAIEVARMLGPQIRGGGDDEDALLGRAIAAHRDGTGRIRRPSPGELDLFRWIIERCRLGYGLLRQPQAYRHDPAPVRQAVAVLYPAHRRAEALVRLDVAWHRDVVRLAAEHDELVAALRAGARRRGRKDAAPPPPSYPHLIDAPTAVGGVTLTPLRGPEAIAAEGREMGHCIGTYAGRAASGYCMLLSLVSDLGRSSAEIVACGPDDRGGKAYLRVVQHQGPRNGPAPVGHPEALRDWIAAQPAGAVSAAAVIANTASRVMYVHRDPYHGIGDEGRARIAALAREQLAPYLHGTMKRQDPAAWRLM